VNSQELGALPPEKISHKLETSASHGMLKSQTPRPCILKRSALLSLLQLEHALDPLLFWLKKSAVSPSKMIGIGIDIPNPKPHLFFAYSSASSVSAVSPLWLTNTAVSSRKMGHCRSRRSLASSIVTGTPDSCSMIWREARAAWKLVPHPMKMMRLLRRMVSKYS
jgi:hypothetical protein